MDRARTTVVACLMGFGLLWIVYAGQSGFANNAPKNQFFESRIRPVLVRHCYECHSGAGNEAKGGLRLDSRAGARKGGESGPAVVPGSVDESLLIDALRHESFEMPPKGKLPKAVIADFVKWIEMGAPDPRDAPPNPKEVQQLVWQGQFEQRRRWWSLKPLTTPSIPNVKDQQWPNGLMDRFILAKLEDKKLHPSIPADRQTLIRRLSFALTGLPPTPADVSTFVEDTAPAAYEALVDRLLASPHFGERFARHWMDVVRYSDTFGYEWDIPAKGAWRYRDFLTRAFNQDVPFDQLLREQIAGDLLEEPRININDRINESLIGVTFYQMGEKRHGDSVEFNGIHQEMLDNKIDAFSKAFQATTIACARCHNHKLDPITQAEYYALGGIFMSSRWVVNTLDTPQRNAQPIHRLKATKLTLRKLLAKRWLTELQTASGLAALRKQFKLKEGEKPGLEDVRFAWLQMAETAAQGNDVTAKWEQLKKQYSDEQHKRTEQNARDFQMLADFRTKTPEDWSVDGEGLRRRVECGDFTVALDGPNVVDRLLPGGLFTHAFSPRLNGAIRTPYLNQFDKEYISFEYCGGDFSANRTVVDNAFLTERQKYLNQPEMGWMQLSTFPQMKQRRIYIELATKTSNPNFPPRVGLGGKCSDEQIADPKSWFGVTRVLLHDKAATPADELSRFSELFAGDSPKDFDGVTSRVQRWLLEAVTRWSKNKATQDDVRLINGMLKHAVITNHHDKTTAPEIAKAVLQYRAIEQEIKVPQTACGMLDADPGYDYRLNIRGDYDQLGDAVPRRYLEVLDGSTEGFRVHGSGRLELANRVASPRNPLTARVFVNRVWVWLFGTGLVSTPNDFGHLGEPPSHRELLDFLASRFVSERWSVKRLVRLIVTSETYRQSGIVSEAARTIDPKNRLLHHHPLRRLEAEAIRDAMLAVSGRFDDALFGAPVNPHRSKEDPQKRLFSGPLDGNGRRSIYTKVTIMEPPKLLATFNQPEPKIPTGKRDITTTPAQSLTLLNDPFVNSQAEYWAKQLVERRESAEQRLTLMFRTALGRNPSEEEISRWSRAVADLAELHRVEASKQSESLAIWKDIAHAFMNTKEFIYIR